MRLSGIRNRPILAALCILVITLLVQASDAVLLGQHNATMLKFARQTIFDKSAQAFNSVAWISIADLLKQQITTASQKAVLHARLASALTAGGNTELAQQHAWQALSASGRTTACYIDSQDFIRWITTPHQTLLRTALSFENPQAYWHLITNNVSRTHISATETADGCEVDMDADFDLAPFRYSMLVQELNLMPNTNYRLSAETRSRGISRAWLGTFFATPGQNIPATSDWQTTIFEFRTSNDAGQDRVHILIEAGHGTLSIRNIKLEVIP